MYGPTWEKNSCCFDAVLEVFYHCIEFQPFNMYWNDRLSGRVSPTTTCNKIINLLKPTLEKYSLPYFIYIVKL